jgi:hypothetical protein
LEEEDRAIERRLWSNFFVDALVLLMQLVFGCRRVGPDHIPVWWTFPTKQDPGQGHGTSNIIQHMAGMDLRFVHQPKKKKRGMY